MLEFLVVIHSIHVRLSGMGGQANKDCIVSASAVD